MRSLVGVWIIWMTGLRDGNSHFRMRVILGRSLIWFLVFHVCVPECSRNGLGVCPPPPVGLTEIRLLYIETQNPGICPAEFLEQFFSDSAFNLLWNLYDLFLVNSRNGRVSWLAVRRTFHLCFFCNRRQFSFVSHFCHLFEGNTLRSY